jgi:hypothetical protein
MHSEKTLDILSDQTQILGHDFRVFEENTCAVFDTKEWTWEADKRYRAEVKNGNSITSAVCKSK